VEVFFILVEEQMSLYPSKGMIVASLVLVALSLTTAGFLVGRLVGLQMGIERGESQAINVRHPSERLEMACAGLWIGEQNKKYFEKYGGNK
jgi:hypothetical protein